MKRNWYFPLVLVSFVVGVVVGCEEMAGDDGSGAAADGDDNWGSDYDYGADMDADTDTDTDTDADADSDGDGYPPEIEETANYLAPKGSGKFVFIVDETNDAVVVVDSETLAIKVVEVGGRPTHLIPLSEDEDGKVAVINLDSDDVTILEVTSLDDIEVMNLEVRPDTNALVASPNGRYVVAFHDPAFTSQSGAPTTDQEITVLDLSEGEENAHHMSVGMHPWYVAFNDAVTRAFVVSEEGINIIDLENLGKTGIPPIVSPFEGGTYDRTTADIEITPDGSLAFARKTDSDALVVTTLNGTNDMRTYTLSAVPTDLDIAADGSFGVLVLRSLAQVAIFDLPLPADVATDPFEIVELGDKVAGVATVSGDGNNILLHTTTAGEAIDKKRLTVLSRTNSGWNLKSTVLEREIRAVATGVKSEVAVVMHQRVNAKENQLPYSYTMLTIPGLQSKFQQVSVLPGQLLFTPDGDFGYLLLEDDYSLDVIDFRSFIVDSLKLGSPPTAAGYASQTDKVFVSQNHPAGRMTFVGVHDGSVKTVTGYNLNDEIEY